MVDGRWTTPLDRLTLLDERTPLDRRTLLATCATAGATAVAGCAGTDGGDGDGGDEDGGDGTDDPASGEAEGEGDLQLSSPAFDDGESIPERYTRDGENVNPPLEVDGVPAGAESLALVVDDPDAPGGTFVHWLAWNVPADVRSIPEGWDPPDEVVEGENDFGNVGYDGPDPPEPHRYRFKLYALETTLDLQSGADVDALSDAMDGNVLARTQLAGTYG